MPFALIPEYEGKSPYVFITYAQQDEKIAYSIAVKMYNEGFRLWSSAACGNPSNMRIAERLSNSEVAMVFLSRSYLKYASYKEFEPRAVMNSPKKKIVICLDDTPLGTDWNTVDFPAGIRYNPDIPQELWLRINSSDTLEKCRGAWPRQPLPLPFEENRAINVSVDAMDEDEYSDELSSLHALMASFDVGIDDRDARRVSLFNRDIPRPSPDRDVQPSQEQEYYTIENLIDNSPMPAQEEQQQYDHMVGLIGTIMERNHHNGKNAGQPAEKTRSEQMTPPPPPESYQPSYREFHAVPKNEFDRVDLSKDISSQPVVITESSELKPIVIDYGEDDTEIPVYNMTRRPSRHVSFSAVPKETEQVSEPIPVTEPKPAEKPQAVEEPKPAEKPQAVPEPAAEAEPEPIPKEQPAPMVFGRKADPAPSPSFSEKQPLVSSFSRFTDDDEIPQPTLRFERPAAPTPSASGLSSSVANPRRRTIVSVRTRVRRTEYDGYDNEMYEVDGRWIPGDIYHRLMPHAKYTSVRRVRLPRQTTALTLPSAPVAPPVIYRSPRPELNAGSRLHCAVNTFFTPAQRSVPQRTLTQRPAAPVISEPLRSALRERREERRSETLRQMQAEDYAAPTVISTRTPAPEDENAPARKHKFSHEGGIKKALMTNMETPVDTSDPEDSHRQFGTRAELASSGDESVSRSAEKKSEKKKEKQKEQQSVAKKAAQKEAEKEKRREAQKKAAQKKAEDEHKAKKKKQSKSSKEEMSSPGKTPTRYHARMPQRFSREGFAEADDDSLLEMPSRNLPNIHYDPEAYRDMNLSEILFGQSSDGKKKKKK